MEVSWPRRSLSEAFLVGPRERLKRGASYPFLDMGGIDPAARCAHAAGQREYTGGGSVFRSGDTLMARITPCLENGKIARFCGEIGEVAHGSTEFIVVRGRQGQSDSGFAYYLLRSEPVRGYAVAQMSGTSGRQRVPTAALGALVVPIPPLPEQRAIAAILGAFDDKIEVNRRMSETLEAMARALFKSWFVDFDPVRAKAAGRDPGLPLPIAELFPTALGREQGAVAAIPSGWDVTGLGSVAQSWRRAVSPQAVAPTTPYVGLEHMPRGRLVVEGWGRAESVSSGKFRFQAGEILFGKLRPHFRKVAVAPVAGVCSTDILVLAPVSEDWFAFVLGHLSSDVLCAFVSAGAGGTRMPRTAWSAIAEFRVALPPIGLARAYDGIVHPIVRKMDSLGWQCRVLGSIRDTLLPKLISGEIRVKQAEKIAQAAL